MNVNLNRFQVFRRDGLVFCGNHATLEQATEHAVRLDHYSGGATEYVVIKIAVSATDYGVQSKIVWSTAWPF